MDSRFRDKCRDVSEYTTYGSAERPTVIAKARAPNADIEVRPLQRRHLQATGSPPSQSPNDAKPSKRAPMPQLMVGAIATHGTALDLR